MSAQTSHDQSLLWTVRSNRDDYRGFPEPGVEWQYEDIDVSRSALQKAAHYEWIESVGESNTHSSGAQKIWRTSEELWAVIQEYCTEMEHTDG